jgi:integrase
VARLKVRYLVAKRQPNGTVLFYWQPNQALRQAGYRCHRLARDTNLLADAVAEAERINADVDAWRAGTKPEPIRAHTLPWLAKLHCKDEAFTRLADSTRRSYRECLKVLEGWSRRAGHPKVTGLARPAIKQFQRTLAEQSRHKSNKVMRVLRILLQFAVDEGYLETNPATKLKLRKTEPRAAVWTPEEVDRFCAAAAAAGRSSVALAVRLAVNLGQREGDVLRLTWAQHDGHAFSIRQGKTGTLIEVPVARELAHALALAPRSSPSIVVSEVTGRPYLADNFRAVFARIRRAAGLSGVQFLDLRRTAVVRLAEAGCTVPEVAAITGHGIETTQKILEVYLPRNSTMARHAIAKLESYRARRVGSSNREAGGGVGSVVPRWPAPSW